MPADRPTQPPLLAHTPNYDSTREEEEEEEEEEEGEKRLSGSSLFLPLSPPSLPPHHLSTYVHTFPLSFVCRFVTFRSTSTEALS